MDASTLMDLIKLPIVASLIGGIVGSVITNILTRANDKRKENRQDNSNRVLLIMEIRKNTKILQNFWTKINEKNRKYEPITKHTLAEVLSKTDLIEWKRDLWDEKNPAIIIALSNDEINKIEIFYENLELILSLHNEIASLYDKIWKEKCRPRPPYTQEAINKVVGELSTIFQERFEEFKKIALETINEGKSLEEILNR